MSRNKSRNKLHPTLLAAILLLISAFISGCETVALYRNNAAPNSAKQVTILRDGAKPPHKFRDIGVLTDDGPLADQGGIEAKFVREARKAGADAIIVAPLVRTGEEFRPFAMV